MPAHSGILSWRDAHGAAEPLGPHLSHSGGKLGDTILGGGGTFTEKRLVACLPLGSPPQSGEEGRGLLSICCHVKRLHSGRLHLQGFLGPFCDVSRRRVGVTPT